MSSPDEPPRGPGDEVAGRYVLEHKLGEGGMGTVWAARNKRTERRVAMKFLRAVGSRSARERFQREARAAGALDHPHVCEVLDVLEDGDDLVMVLELLEGETLAQLLADRERISTEEAARLLLPVVSAMGAAHARGIIHRDLKPENIFVTRDRGVKVLDFGIAKVGADEAGAALTVTGSLLGTPAYMAPEQVFGESDLDHRADIWALGLVLYKCLSGVLPTEVGAGNVGQVLKKIVARPIRPLRELAADVPEELHDLVMRMLARDPAKRPASLGDAFDALRRHTDVRAPGFGEPMPTARPPRTSDDASQEPLDGDVTEAPASTRSSKSSLRGVEASLVPAPRRWRHVVLGVGGAAILLGIGWSFVGATPAASSASSAAPPLPSPSQVEATPPQVDPPQIDPPEVASSAASPLPSPPAATSAKPSAPLPARPLAIVPTASASATIDPLGDAR